jgi:hypothetical protein
VMLQCPVVLEVGTTVSTHRSERPRNAAFENVTLKKIGQNSFLALRALKLLYGNLASSVKSSVCLPPMETLRYSIRRHHLSSTRPASPRVAPGQGPSPNAEAEASYCTRLSIFHAATLVGRGRIRVLFRRPTWRWTPLTHRPWTSTSIADFWSLLGTFVCGSRPGRALFFGRELV